MEPYGQEPDPQNPYQPPGGFGTGNQMPAQPGPRLQTSQWVYRPLGWKTTLACLSIGIIASVDLLSLGLIPFLREAGSHRALVMLVSAAAKGAGLISIAAMVLFFIWTYRAAVNARGLGNELLQISPGWTIGWWFIPFASFVMPYRTMAELWRSSDPAARREGTTEWTLRGASGLVGAWWGCYLGSGVIQWVNTFSLRVGGLGLGTVSLFAVVSVLLKVLAAIFVILVMRGIDRRQQETATMLGMSSSQ